MQASSAWLWCARLLWVVLPVSCGTAFADALDGWSTEPAAVAAALLWLAWAAGLLALFAPRPWGLTLLRIVAPLGVVSAATTFAGAGAGAAMLAVGTTGVAAVFALSAPVNEAAGNALAYGDEVRVPLRIPTPLLLGPIPLGLLLLGACIATGPIALADGRVALGVAAIIVGFPVAFAGVRSLHALAKRWLVLVPAGLTLVDPLTLLDPVLIRRQQVTALRSRAGAGDRRACARSPARHSAGQHRDRMRERDRVRAAPGPRSVPRWSNGKAFASRSYAPTRSIAFAADRRLHTT